MQFLIYLTVLMISVSTVLLEIHWLTTAPPQPKATVGTAAAPLPPKPEGPNAALSPVYPKKLDSSQQPESANQQAQVSTTNTSAGATSETITSAQSPATANASAPPQNSPTETNPPTETMGVSTRENETRQTTAAVNPPEGRSSQQSVATGTSPNRCDVQACANAYRSFRASDCSYQPFEGSRRFCLKPPVHQTARDQREPERRWSRDVESRSIDRSTAGRRLDNDDGDEGDDAGFDDSPPNSPTLFFFGRRGW